MSNNPEINDIRILRKIFGLTPHPTLIERRDFDRWYRDHFQPYLWVGKGSFYRVKPELVEPISLHLPKIQHGGNDDEIFSYQSQGQTYHMKITHLEAKRARHRSEIHLILLSPSETYTVRHCILVMILPETPTVALMEDVSTQFPCTDKGNPPHAGQIFIPFMMKYLIEHSDQLGINRIELVDEIYHYCQDKRDYPIRVELSRQLEGDYPYYMQFGFKPEKKSAIRKLRENRTKISTLLAKDYDLSTIPSHIPVPQQISTYFRLHQLQSLTQSLKYISRLDCPFYSQIYRFIFDFFKLKELEGDEINYYYQIK